jgi:ribosomal protein S18 acetylase RimI-like enzyme
MLKERVRADSSLLERPPWSALTTMHASFALGNNLARRYRPDVAPMAAVREVSEQSLQALHAVMRPGDVVGLFDARPVAGAGLDVIVHKTIEQMVHEGDVPSSAGNDHEVLTAADVPAMMALVELTRPGPFAPRAIELGSFIGIRSGGGLIAMAGERMRFDGFTEISAVCTHPAHQRRGLSSALVRDLIRSISGRGETPFLHIYSDNTRAASLYERLGFVRRRSLTVTVLRRPN